MNAPPHSLPLVCTALPPLPLCPQAPTALLRPRIQCLAFLWMEREGAAQGHCWSVCPDWPTQPMQTSLPCWRCGVVTVGGLLRICLYQKSRLSLFLLQPPPTWGKKPWFRGWEGRRKAKAKGQWSGDPVGWQDETHGGQEGQHQRQARGPGLSQTEPQDWAGPCFCF